MSNKTDLNQADYTLEDCVERAKQNNGAFIVPSKEAIDNLHPGSLVKLMFHPRHTEGQKTTGELLWVEITTILDNSRFVGFLVNEPDLINGVHAKEVIKFETRHISSIFTESTLPAPIKKVNPTVKTRKSK